MFIKMKKLIYLISYIFSLQISILFAQTTLIQLTNGTNDRNPVFTNYNNSNSGDGYEELFMAFERTTGSLNQIIIERIGLTGPLDTGRIIVSNTFINRNPSIAMSHPDYPVTAIRKGLIVWETNKNGNWDLYASRYNYLTGWSAPFPIDSSLNDQSNVCINYLDSTFISILYQNNNNIKFKRYNYETNYFSSDSNLTYSEPLICSKPFVQTMERFPDPGKVTLVVYEKEINTSQRAIYFVKGTLSGNIMNWTLPDTVAYTGINKNPYINSAGTSSAKCFFETNKNGSSDIYVTELRFYNNTKIQQTVVSSNIYDEYSYCGGDLILGDIYTNMFYGYLKKSSSDIKSVIRFPDSLITTVSTNTSYVSKMSRGIMNAYFSACERMWIVFNKESLPQYTSRIFGAHVTSCAMGTKKISSTTEEFKLEQNFPNPFNPNTITRYQIKDSRFVTLKVYDILGKEVAVLVNEKQSPGTYEVQFPNRESANVQLTSGVYFYTLYADGERIDTKRMVLLK
jgi:hypothetical protein